MQPRQSGLQPQRVLLLVAFAFAVMADPVSPVAYAIEAALRALSGDLGLLLPTMTVVIAVIAVVTLNYHQIVARYPAGGGAAAAVGDAFGGGGPSSRSQPWWWISPSPSRSAPPQAPQRSSRTYPRSAAGASH